MFPIQNEGRIEEIGFTVYSEKDNADQSIDNFKEKMSLASNGEDFPGGPVAKTARPNAGDLGSISGRGTGSHML